MKKTFKNFLTESQRLSHWPKTVEELEQAYMKICVDDDTGEVMMPPVSRTRFSDQVMFNDDLTVSIKRNSATDRVQIAESMLVNGQLPFPFKDVDSAFVVNNGCKLKSLAGFPRSCSAVSIEENGLDESVKNLEGGPEEIKFSLSIFSCPGIESLKGFPRRIVNDEFNLSVRYCENLRDFSDIPKKLEKCTIGKTEHFTVENLKDLPSDVEILSLDQLPNLTSLHNIHKFVKNAKRLSLYQTKIFSSILGLAMITGLNEVEESFYDVNNEDKSWPTDGIIPIVEKYMGTQEVFDFQEELVEAGFKELAKL